MQTETIQNLEKLLQKYTGPSKKLIDSKITKLTEPGENYIGLLFNIEATLQDDDGQEEKFIAVAKCLNLKIMKFSFGTIPKQFKKEQAFYTEIIPTLQRFQNETNLEERSIQDLFPTLYTYRNSLNENSGEPDENAVLLLENLFEKGK